MSKPSFMNGGMVASPSPGKATYASTSTGKQERPRPASAVNPGSAGNSVRPRVSVRSSIQDGCFCNKRGQ
jgi:hypothetical protein